MKNEPSAIEALNWRNDLDIIKINLENLTETCGLNAQEIAILLARVSRVKDFIKQALKKAEAYDRVSVSILSDGDDIVVHIGDVEIIREYYPSDNEIYHTVHDAVAMMHIRNFEAQEKYNYLMSKCAEIMINEKQSTRRAYAITNLIEAEMKGGE